MPHLDASPALTGRAKIRGYTPAAATPTKAPLTTTHVGQLSSPVLEK